MLDTLLVEDEDDVRACIASSLEDAGHRVTQASDGEQAAALIGTRMYDLVICDVQLPKVDGITLARRLRHIAPTTAVVVMTSHARVEDVIDVMRGGALEYVTKPFDPVDFVRRIVGPLAERRALQDSIATAHRAHAQATRTHVIAESEAMWTLLGRVKGFAQSDVPLLLHGERGTGKKTLARMLHESSPRRDGPFVIVTCGTLPDLMLEAELQYASGAGIARREAWFREAEGGTLVLDGVDTLKLSAQAAVVRVLTEPSTSAHRDDLRQPRGVRVVATSQRDPRDLVKSGQLLESLYFRIAGVTDRVPPLREREGDLLPLVADILATLTRNRTRPSSIEPSAIEALSRHTFPGNVAELAWALESALFLAGPAPIEAKHLTPRIARAKFDVDPREDMG
jgi:DNA-binding NtrC family response regulator